MPAKLQSLLLLAACTDANTEAHEDCLRARCLHCRTTLILSKTGKAISAVTLEHIVAQSWFEKPRVIARLFAEIGAVAPTHADDARNLALACQRCNQGKGSRLDTKPSDTRAREVVAALWQKRQSSFLLPTLSNPNIR
jgi:5-methylcytosine-specific restriction endonuclease McrA